MFSTAENEVLAAQKEARNERGRVRSRKVGAGSGWNHVIRDSIAFAAVISLAIGAYPQVARAVIDVEKIQFFSGLDRDNEGINSYFVALCLEAAC
jgi:hypothetical protein